MNEVTEKSPWWGTCTASGTRKVGLSVVNSSSLVPGQFVQDLNLLDPQKKNSTTQPQHCTQRPDNQWVNTAALKVWSSGGSISTTQALARSANSRMLVTSTLNKFSLERGQKKAPLVHIPESTWMREQASLPVQCLPTKNLANNP